MHNPWIPEHMRYMASMPCGRCKRFTKHAEVIRGRWRCEECKSSCHFEEKSDIHRYLPDKRTYVYNREEGRFEPGGKVMLIKELEKRLHIKMEEVK